LVIRKSAWLKVKIRVSIEILTFIHHMRNTTKLKQILLKYDVDISMDEENLMKLTLVDKITGSHTFFEHNSYSQLINKGFSHFMKELKKAEGLRLNA
jgi:hypothetical protein